MSQPDRCEETPAAVGGAATETQRFSKKVARRFECQRSIERGQFDKEVIGDFHGKYLVAFFDDVSMANRLAMDQAKGVMQLFAAGMSEG